MEFELKLIEILQSGATYGWIKFFGMVTMLGGFLGVIFGGVLLWKRGKGLSVWLVITFAVASLVNLLLKTIFARQRPFEVSDKIMNLGGESGYSFPSGHSLTAGIIATFLMYGLVTSKQKIDCKLVGGVVICLYPLLIALSRMVLGVHYLTDTIAGIILGVSLALISIKIYNSLVKKIRILKQKEYDEDE